MKKSKIGLILILISSLISIGGFFLPQFTVNIDGNKFANALLFPNGYNQGMDISILYIAVFVAIFLTILFAMVGFRVLVLIFGVASAFLVGLVGFVDKLSGTEGLESLLETGLVKQGPSVILLIVGAIAILISTFVYFLTAKKEPEKETE